MRRQGLHFPILILCLLFVLVSCEKRSNTEEFDDEKFGFDYFPLEEGLTWIYEVDSTVYDNDGATVINSISYIKEEIVESYEDDLGDNIFRIERYWRPNDSVAWEVTDVWTSFRNDQQAYRVEENLKFVKFVFPPFEGTRWNGNLFFDETTIVIVAGENISMFSGWDDYRIIDVDIEEEIGSLQYQKVATVLLTDDGEENTIERRYALEKFARGVGLIYKEYEILDSQCSTCTEPWSEKAEKGFILKQTLIEHY